MQIKVSYQPNERQKLFHLNDAEEVVYGGAKGGGKSCGLVMECFAYMLEFPGSTAYLFRETYDDLEANLIAEWKSKVPAELYQYSETKHHARLINGSKVFFRYISNDIDADKYQGRSIDWIGIDELTKHSRKAVQILLSCLRSPKGFPPRFRGTCNPGGKGHQWVKERYINKTVKGANQYLDPETGNTVAFIPAMVYDNTVIMQHDPAYVRRLENLPPDQRKAFLEGDWDIFEGQYFEEFRYDIHVIKPFQMPAEWRTYFVMDYGMDMLAGYFIKCDTYGRAYVYKEIYQGKDNGMPGLIVSAAASRIKELTLPEEKIYEYIGPPDLRNTQKDTGKSLLELFADNGLYFTIASNARIDGWMNMHEWLKVYQDEFGQEIAHLRIFNTCRNLIETLPALRYDEKDPNDASTEPHEVTHAPDAIRYFLAGRPYKTMEQVKKEAPKIIDQLRIRGETHGRRR
ncbi:MAG: phage terminase large subunit [Eubacteriales bacterium]